MREKKEGRRGRKDLVYNITISQFFRIPFSHLSNVPPIQYQFALRREAEGRERETDEHQHSQSSMSLTSPLPSLAPLGSGTSLMECSFGLCYQDTTEASPWWKSWSLSLCSWPWTSKAHFLAVSVVCNTASRVFP